MHRNKRTPTHRFPVASTGTFGTGYAKEREPVNADERRMRGYPRTATEQKPKSSGGAVAILRKIMRAARALKRTKEVSVMKRGQQLRFD